MADRPATNSPGNRCQIVYWPGEGLVAEIETDFGRQYFTLQGLQWLVLDSKRRGQPAPIEEAALRQLSEAYDGQRPYNIPMFDER